MDDYMSIAALSVDMNQFRVNQSLGMAIMKEAIDVSAENLDDVLSMASAPGLGETVDVMA